MGRSDGRRSGLPVTRQHSAGGVVVRRCDGRLHFLAIKPAHRDRWQLPKGTIDRGETSAEAALREVREEGGVHCRILADLGAINYFYQVGSNRFSKTVDFYLMEYRSGDPADHDHEVQEARWIPLEQMSRLAFATERDIVGRGKAALSEGLEINPPAEGTPGPPGVP